MNKFFVLIIILIIAPFLGGIYGILHDQITYTISEEYYSKFKFVQFGLDNWGLGYNISSTKTPEIKLHNPRIGAAIVGFLSTWWVGLCIGVFLGVVGFIQKSGKNMFKVVFKSFLFTIAIAFLTGVIGLIYGKLVVVKGNINWFIPDNLIDIDAFLMVGSMHNFSYLGGVLGLVFGIYYSFKQKVKLNRDTVN
ncbi:hypothetical protein GCM10022291_12530 [Postechiella marina]|uniref:Signal peptide-containing protein n=1 Tax=Postechiella marina TaxID=943941 RepID=A0ABP8C5I4_9FLAO